MNFDLSETIIVIIEENTIKPEDSKSESTDNKTETEQKSDTSER